jgi:hypothetical protein
MRPLDNCLKIKDTDSFMPTHFGEVLEVGENRDSHGIQQGATVLFRKSPDTLYNGDFFVHWTDVYLCNNIPTGHYITALPVGPSQKGGTGEYKVMDIGDKVSHVKKGEIIVAKVFGSIELEDGLQLIDEMDSVCIA